MPLTEQIDAAIKQAMIERNALILGALRNVKKAIIEARTAAGAAAELTDAVVVKLIQKLIKQNEDAAAIYKTQNRDDLYQEEMAQANALRPYLPKQLDDAELAAVLQKIITETGAQSVKEMGKVIALANVELAGSADSKTISEKVKQLLS